MLIDGQIKVLIDQVKACHSEKYSILIRRFQHDLTGYVRSLLKGLNLRDKEFIIEESVARAFLNVFYALKAGRPENSGAFASYLFKTAFRVLKDQRKSQKQVMLSLSENPDLKNLPSYSIEDELIARDTFEAIYKKFKADKSIKPVQKKILELRLFTDELEPQEIAERLGVDLKHVYYVIRRFRLEILPQYMKDLTD